MEVIAKPRGGGKTTEILKRMQEAQELGRLRPIMLVADWHRSQALTRRNPDLADSIFTYRHLLEGQLNGMPYDGIWIDDIEEYILQTARHHHVAGFSMSILPSKEWDT